MGTERKRKTSVSAKLGRAATTNGTAAAAAAAAVANQPLIGEVPRVPRHSRSAARSPCDSRRTISSPSSTTTRPSSSSEKPEAASTQMESHHSTSTPKSIDPPPSVQGSGTPVGRSSSYLDFLSLRSSATTRFQYGVDKVFQPLPSSPSMGHELLCWISVRSGESVFRPLPSLPSTGQSAFPSATTLHLYTHITLKPSYAMYYVDLVMKPSNVLS
uniref:Uncharacterized protein n=1 Tax=Oryza meridionalis TaxID=40149 RepID=A0A0E0CJS6_9ORYZ